MSDTGDITVHELLERTAAAARRIDEDDSDFGLSNLGKDYRSKQKALLLAAEGDVGAVVAGLHDADPWVRSEAAAALGRLFEREAVPPLEARQHDPEARVRDWVQWALVWITRAPEPILPEERSLSARLAALSAAARRHPLPEARLYAIGALAGRTDAVSALVAAATDGDDGVRAGAFAALAVTPCAAALGALCAAVGRGEPGAISEVGRGWQEMRSDAALDAVMKQAESREKDIAQAAGCALELMAVFETEEHRRERLAGFVVRALRAGVDLNEVGYRVAAALADERLASVVAGSVPPPIQFMLKWDALDAMGAAGDEALLAASRDPKLSEEARKGALWSAITRGLADPGEYGGGVVIYDGRWRDQEGRTLDLVRNSTTHVTITWMGPGGEGPILKADARVGNDGFLRFTLENPSWSARCGLRRRGSMILAEVELVGQVPGGGRHWLGRLTPASAYHRADLPASRYKRAR